MWAIDRPSGRCPHRIARPGGSKPPWKGIAKWCMPQRTPLHGNAEALINLLGAVELVVALKDPKSGFRTLSEFFTRQSLKYSLKTGRPFPRPICTREALDAEWRARCTPF